MPRTSYFSKLYNTLKTKNKKEIIREKEYNDIKIEFKNYYLYFYMYEKHKEIHIYKIQHALKLHLIHIKNILIKY